MPKGLKREFGPGHLVLTVPEAGWAGIKNGQMLNLATSKFDVFITTDTNLEYQQTLAKVRFCWYCSSPQATTSTPCARWFQ
ncbi:MAG: hypothetical protein LC667_10190, partial [Thioalkalivibrio sp.]|nr:hypothetical protein [Thioalkalivibrio sp.]